MTSAETVLARYRWASRFINGLIQGPPSPPPGATSDQIRARSLARLERLRGFLHFLGNPQQRYRSVHVGGTSGKGSTSAFIASILTAAGYRTGLHVSPYLQVETEKLQIDGRLLAGDQFADHVESLDRLVNEWLASGGERLTYGEFWVALTFFAFAREAMEWAVIEVGAGGRFDLTNVLQSDVAVITSVGLDHVRTLGGTIPEIAWHKAGIIKPGCPAVTTVTDADALEVIARAAREQHAPLTSLLPGRDYQVLESNKSGTRLLDKHGGRIFETALIGTFQGANAAAAIAAARAIPDLPHGEITDDNIALGLANARFPGRMEIVQQRPLVVLDGAHNPEKMTSFIENALRLNRPSRRVLVLGALDGHDFVEMARIAGPVADEVIITSPRAIQRASASTAALESVIRALGRPAKVVPEPEAAIAAALDLAGPDDQILVTGSLYLVGQVRERWYASDDIILAESCWPEGNGWRR